MTRAELKEMIRECLHEELSTRRLKETVEPDHLAVIFTGDKFNDRDAILSKVTEPRHTLVSSVEDFIREFDNAKNVGFKKGLVKFYADDKGMQELEDLLADAPAYMADPILNATTLLEDTLTESALTAEEKVDAWHAGTRRENYKAAGIPKLNTFLEIAEAKGYTEIVDIIKNELIARKAKETFTSKLRDGTVGWRTDGTFGPLKSTEPEEETPAKPAMDWEELIDAADELLDELCIETDNTWWDTSDGYWSSDVGTEWTMRNLYLTNTLDNADKLKKLCDEYSKKLPNVRFYCYEDDIDEDPVSEIGYVATNREELSKKPLTENAGKAYKALMKVQDFIQNFEGWEIVDCQQDDEYSMTIKCDTEYSFDEYIDDLEDFSQSCGVSADMYESNRKGYDVIIYLSYEG